MDLQASIGTASNNGASRAWPPKREIRDHEARTDIGPFGTFNSRVMGESCAFDCEKPSVWQINARTCIATPAVPQVLKRGDASTDLFRFRPKPEAKARAHPPPAEKSNKANSATKTEKDHAARATSCNETNRGRFSECSSKSRLLEIRRSKRTWRGNDSNVAAKAHMARMGGRAESFGTCAAPAKSTIPHVHASGAARSAATSRPARLKHTCHREKTIPLSDRRSGARFNAGEMRRVLEAGDRRGCASTSSKRRQSSPKSKAP
mmetsp:Transcript_25246/g.86575  ORF Transcript_25246/g.86575 Transcript_25246/m.86575 type:complete len:263 (-) Transcript_25246:1790-2578(-)